jgi:tripartite-type tricarboxylate transporter receptor subunit TctC
VPKKTPVPVVKAIQLACARALHAPDLKKRIEELGNTPVGSSPEEFDAFIAADMKKWAKVIKDAKIPLE